MQTVTMHGEEYTALNLWYETKGERLRQLMENSATSAITTDDALEYYHGSNLLISFSHDRTVIKVLAVNDGFINEITSMFSTAHVVEGDLAVWSFTETPTTIT